jgi:LysM repeat protein
MRLARYRGRHLKRRPRGKGIAVGAATAVWVAGPTAAAREYVVRPGDTLSAIATRLGTSVSRLARTNHLSNPNRIIAGTRLRVPGSGGSAASSSGGTYVVRSGDTLGSIAAKLGTSVSALARANDISNPNFIVAGTRLSTTGGGSSATPAPIATSATHVVRPGETLSSIAARYGATVSSLAKRNRLSNPNMVVAGTKLRVPGARNESVPAAPAATSTGSIEASLTNQASSHGVDVSLVKAVAYLESGWQQDAISSVGAVGVMQVLPSTARYINASLGGHNLNVRDADDNVHLGVMYLDHLIATLGSEERALAGYYTGPGNVGQKLNKAQRWYVNQVMAIRERYR